MKRDDHEWACEKEPDYRAPSRPRIPLHEQGAVRVFFFKPEPEWRPADGNESGEVKS